MHDYVVNLRKERKKDIRIIIIMEIVIKKISLLTVILAAIQLTLMSIQKKKRATATSWQRNQLEIMAAANKAIKNHIPKLEIIYKCWLKNCNNHDKCYYILGIIDYLLLNNHYLIAWNNAINDGTANIETPSMLLIG